MVIDDHKIARVKETQAGVKQGKNTCNHSEKQKRYVFRKKRRVSLSRHLGIILCRGIQRKKQQSGICLKTIVRSVYFCNRQTIHTHTQPDTFFPNTAHVHNGLVEFLITITASSLQLAASVLHMRSAYSNTYNA